MDNLKNENINVEEIMKKIKENVDKKKALSGDITPAASIVHEEPRPENVDLAYLRDNWYIHNNNYRISSHRKLTGPVLVKGREMVNGEIRRYMDPIISQQNEFNSHIARAIESINYRSIDAEAEISALDAKIEQMKSDITNYTDTRLKEVIASVDQDINNKAWLAKMLEGNIEKPRSTIDSPPKDSNVGDINYFVFEERFRGPSQDIKEKQSMFIPYFKGCKNVLDIGCGRGEFLETMRECGSFAHGIDIDCTMIDCCRSKGLDIEKIDALEYLKKIPDQSLDGIFIDQVVEHLESDYLIDMLKLSHKKLKFGYYLCVETVNPSSFMSLVNFYVDMTHKRPIHPETLRFLFSSVGFREIDVKFTAPVEDKYKLRKIYINPSFDEHEKGVLTIYNYNIDRLNDVLYGAQDYSVIGKK